MGLDHVPPSADGMRDGLKALGYDVGSEPTPLVSTVMEEEHPPGLAESRPEATALRRRRRLSRTEWT